MGHDVPRLAVLRGATDEEVTMYSTVPDAVSGRYLVRDPERGVFPVPIYSKKVADDFATLLNQVAKLGENDEAVQTLRAVRRCGAPLLDC